MLPGFHTANQINCTFASDKMMTLTRTYSPVEISVRYARYAETCGFTGHEHYAEMKIINMKAPNKREQTHACSFFVGGLAGLAGGAAGGATAAAVGVGGFLGGAASDAAAGAASCFITGTGNALIAGNDLATSLKCGLMGGAIGALGGALMGGLSRGILDARQGYNFWDGSFYEEYVTGGIGPDGGYSAIADYYNSNSIADQYDYVLNHKINDMFGVQTGDFNIKEFTTRPSDFGIRNSNYGMTDDFQFVNLKKWHLVGGYVTGNSATGTHVHVSPYSINSGDVVFRAVAGHELTHAYHHYLSATMGYAFNHLYSERASYQYTFNVFISKGYVYRAAATMRSALRLNFWSNSYPFFYQSPF